MEAEEKEIAVLVSGGLDSSVLAAELCAGHERVYPLYIRQGLLWEEVELFWLQRFLREVRRPQLAALRILHLPVSDLYGEHWALSGAGIPGAETPDDAVYLPGRNLLLLAKAAVFCSINRISRLALASLEGNPFPDATPEFFREYGDLAGAALEHPLEILTPFRGLTKVHVVIRGRDLPLQFTFSCLSPQGNNHCGTCNKCAERRRAFALAGTSDPTSYATR